MAIMRATNLLKLAMSTTLLAVCTGAFAGTVVPKPGVAGVQSSEFGSTVARFGDYTAVGAMMETVVIPGEPIFGDNPVGGQGVVYLFKGASSNPERRYQFAGNDHFFKRAGAKVAISNKWLAFAATEDTSSDGKSKVYIVGKTNNQWPQCPTVNGALDCTSLVKANGAAGNQPILSIDFPGYVHLERFALAISDDYLAMGNQRTSELFFYRYDATQQQWVQEYNLQDLPFYNLGAGLAIEGDKIAVSGDAELNGGGFVHIYKRSASGVWNISETTSQRLYTPGDYASFGRTLVMHEGNLVVGSGLDYNSDGSDPEHSLSFYRVNNYGYLEYLHSVHLSAPHRHLALYGDTAVVTAQGIAEKLIVYKRDAASNTWMQTAALNGNLYFSPNTGLAYPSSDPIDLFGDNLVLGWRAHNRNNGAIIHERISQIDYCKSTQNLVANCSFDGNSGAGWQFLNHMGASAWASYNGGEMTVTTHYGGTIHWHIQARTPVNLSAGGTYELGFRARADSYRDITVNIGHNGNQDNNWVSYGQTTFRPGPQWEEYTYEFNGVPSDADSFLDFNLGNAGTARVTIDGISLRSLNN